MDAVESSKFITARKSSELAEKLSQMTSVYQSEELKRNIYISERVKPMNEQIYYLVDNINTAINQGKQISFLYYHYNQYREEVPNNDGKRYHFSPYYHVWNEDHSLKRFGYLKTSSDGICEAGMDLPTSLTLMPTLKLPRLR